MTFEPPSIEALGRYGLALGLGAVIGLERERHRPDKVVLAGVRTYPLVSLSGLVCALLSVQFGLPVLVSVGALIAGAFALLMYWVRQAHGTTGLTSPIALFSTYFVGVLVGVDRQWEAIVAGLAIALLLFTKERLHRVAEVMTPQEMEGALYFLVLAFILYPITPSGAVDAWGLFRPRASLLLVLLVSLISFLSFLAMRRWGTEFGLPFSGFLGGLVNSEAAAVSLATLYEKRATLQGASYSGILLATATMFLRNLVIAALADPTLALLRRMLIPMTAATIVLLGWSLLRRSTGPTGKTRLDLESPFAFRPAFLFAFWFTAVGIATLLLTKAAGFGAAGTYFAALGGFVSAGAVVASLGTLYATGNAALPIVARAAILASLFSAVNKIIISRLTSPRLSRRLVAPVAAAVAAGGILLLLDL